MRVRIVRTWFTGYRCYIGWMGEVVHVLLSSLCRECDGLVVRLDDDGELMFSRYEVEEVGG